MAKRLIDTNIFRDPWFMDLGKDAKILWIYLFCNCDHAGIYEINERLLKFETGITAINKAFEQLGNRCVTVRQGLYFIPKFLYFQYPSFPNSKVKAQDSAIQILEKHGLFLNGCLTLTEPLPKDYGNGNGYGNDNIDTWKTKFEIYKEQVRNMFEEIISDKKWMQQQEKYNPNIDVRLSIEKSIVNYWGKEAGWKKKKSARIDNPDWKATFANAITMPTNKVYK